MNPDRWERLIALYERAETLDPNEREAFLRGECQDDPELLAELRAMLALDVPQSFMRSPVGSQRKVDMYPSLEGSILGEYKVLRRLGSGGQGTVYLAEEPKLHRLVALKILPREGRDQRAMLRFEREAIAAAALDHPHIVKTIASGTREDLAWYTMRYVRGWDLCEELERQRAFRSGKSEVPLAWPAFESKSYIRHCVEQLAAVADGVGYAHRAGIVHRDVKPHNIMLDEGGQACLTDFGLARDERFGGLSLTDAVQGTPYYMSPEQVRALDEPVDHRTDIYSLGVVLYEALTLRRPFDGKTSQEVFRRITNVEPPELAKENSRVPRDLSTIVSKAMGKHPSWRYSTAAELAADLRRFLANEAIHARPVSLATKTWRMVLRHRYVALGAVLILTAALVAGWLTYRAQVEAEYRKAEKRLALLSTSDANLSLPELLSLRELSRTLDAQGDGLPATLRQEVDRVVDWFDRHLEQRLGELKSLRERALGSKEILLEGDLPQPVPYQREAIELLQSQYRTLVRDLSHLYPDDPRVADLVRNDIGEAKVKLRLHPRHALVPGIENARIMLRPIDHYESQVMPAIEYGRWSDGVVSIPTGYAVIVVDLPGFGFAELVRHIEPRDEPYEFNVWLRPTSEVVDLQRMKAMPAGEFSLVREIGPEQAGCYTGGDVVALAGFYVDYAVCSNAEYEEFLRASDADAPLMWTELGYRLDGNHGDGWNQLLGARMAEWPALPVVGIDWYEALAYAEWRGMSLPMHHEVHRYTRGLDNWRAPDLPPPGALVPDFPNRVNVLENRSFSGGPILEQYDLYMKHAIDVRAPAYRQAPEGLFHALGNVGEFTMSAVVEKQRARLITSKYQVLLLGVCGWDTRVGGAGSVRPSWQYHAIRGVGRAYRMASVSIRCIKRFAP